MISTTHVITPHLYKEMPYDPIKDFTPVMKLGEGPYVLVVHPSLGVKSVAELIALAKKEPNKIDYASSGNGSSQHLVGALFAVPVASIIQTMFVYFRRRRGQRSAAAASSVTDPNVPGAPAVIP